MTGRGRKFVRARQRVLTVARRNTLPPDEAEDDRHAVADHGRPLRRARVRHPPPKCPFGRVNQEELADIVVHMKSALAGIPLRRAMLTLAKAGGNAGARSLSHVHQATHLLAVRG
jgi:hypothetical protein